jgi:hypothetical protein
MCPKLIVPRREIQKPKTDEKFKEGKKAERIADGCVPAVEELDLCWSESSVFHQLKLHCGARNASTCG